MHSDGSIRELLADIIDCGVDVINPVQTNAQGMEPGPLKAEYGKDVCFWGGIDTQKVLPFGSAAEVAQEVRDRIGDLGSGGGYVVASVHNIQSEVPPENVVAMYDTVRESI
jgi:uroporphyrinogen decarboxylase